MVRITGREAQVQESLFKSLRRITAVAVLTGLGMGSVGTSAHGQGKPRNWKDTAEYDMYNEVSKDDAGKNYTKMITDLDAWKAKEPQSDYSDVRDNLYVAAYNESKQF